jgi:hypothetical protein
LENCTHFRDVKWDLFLVSSFENQLIQNMQIPKKSKIPKIISGIVATFVLIALAWIALSPFWFWVSFEILAALLVASGCSGEWWLHHHPAGKKRNEKDEHHKIESRFIAMVSVGVIMECFALGHSIREGAKLENKVSEANERVSTNELQSANLRLELEKLKQPRVISAENRRMFIEMLRSSPKGNVRIGTRHPNSETSDYAMNIAGMVENAGFTNISVANYNDNIA